MNKPTDSSPLERRRFASPCIIPSNIVADLPVDGSISIPAVATRPPEKSLELVEVDGIIREILLRCPCEREHRIGLDYDTVTEQLGQA